MKVNLMNRNKNLNRNQEETTENKSKKGIENKEEESKKL